MRIEKIAIENFRLLQSAEMSLERTTTLIVGRNNSGKTSITEFFAHVLGDEPKKLRLEDFSAARREAFLAAKQLRREGKDEKDVLAALPVISATVFVSYDPADELGALAPFVIDLDPGCKTAQIRIDYRPAQTALALLLDPPVPEEQTTRLISSRTSKTLFRKPMSIT